MDHSAPDAREIFERAAKIASTAEREAYLDDACAGRPEIRQEVEALLGTLEDASGASGSSPTVAPDEDAATGLADPPDAAPAGSSEPTRDHTSSLLEAGMVVAGRYVLVEPIGEGGMGSVWLARQTEPVKRLVAVKLIRAGMDSERVIARFEAERQALALMDHPNIAKILDGGLHEGRPFFVMELVKGQPITKFCDARRLAPRERVELFATVCQAIQHAHQKGIIHRDIKPSNVLVTLCDDRPTPKVIDFGVAKATGAVLTERSIDTGWSGVVGTYEYMSPEQATIGNPDIDTRSDVYSLGVLLYELLTGAPPFSREQLEKQGLMEILRVVREVEPPRPSTKISTADALPSLAANRGTEPEKLTSLLRRELDWIVMKAIEKDRARRYETANGFAMDLQRYLAGEPVLAHPPSAVYRLRKLARRRRGPLIAASLVFLSLMAGVVGTGIGLVRAQRSAREANAVVRFFEDHVLSAGRPKGEGGGLGHDISLQDAVEASLPSLAASFRDQPRVEARLRSTLGATFFSLGQPAKAAKQQELARGLWTRVVGSDHPDTLECMNNLANSYDALGRRAEALKLREETLTARKRTLRLDHPDVLQSMNNLANSYAISGRLAEALKLREETLATQRRVLPPDHPDTLMSMHNLAAAYSALGRWAEALKLEEETLRARRRTLPPDHSDTLQTMNNLAISHAMLNHWSEALRLLEETLAARRRALPSDHPDTLSTMNNLANSYADLGRHAEALKLLEESLAIQRRVLPSDHSDTLATMHNLAAVHANLGHHAEALKLREEILAIRRRTLPLDHPDTLQSMNNLANSYADLGRHAEALPLLDEVIAKSARPGVSPRMLPLALTLKIQCRLKSSDLAGCRADVKLLEEREPADAGDLYNVACARALTGALQAKAKERDAAKLAKEDADKAMNWLRQAVAAGWNDAAHMKGDPDLEFLRDRDDFKQLVKEMEKKGAKP